MATIVPRPLVALDVPAAEERDRSVGMTLSYPTAFEHQRCRILLLVRGAERGREMAIQAALGAGTGRLVRRLLAEAGILAGLGAVGVAWAIRGYCHGLPEQP